MFVDQQPSEPGALQRLCRDWAERLGLSAVGNKLKRAQPGVEDAVNSDFEETRPSMFLLDD